jgi:hypothetical protein
VKLSLYLGLALFAAWIVLVFALHIAAGPVHLLYAGACILLARAVLLS